MEEVEVVVEDIVLALERVGEMVVVAVGTFRPWWW